MRIERGSGRLLTLVVVLSVVSLTLVLLDNDGQSEKQQERESSLQPAQKLVTTPAIDNHNPPSANLQAAGKASVQDPIVLTSSKPLPKMETELAVGDFWEARQFLDEIEQEGYVELLKRYQSGDDRIVLYRSNWRLRAVLSRLMELYPLNLLEHISNGNYGEDEESRVRQAISAWTQLHAEDAIARMEAEQDVEMQMAMASAILTEADFLTDAQIHALQPYLDAKGQTQRIGVKVIRMAIDAPEASLALLMTNELQYDRKVLSDWLDNLPVLFLERALAQVLPTLEEYQSYDFVNRVFKRLGQYSPESALLVSRRLTDEHLRSSALTATFSNYPAERIDVGLALAHSIREEADKTTALVAMYETWWENEPNQALQALIREKSVDVKSRFLQFHGSWIVEHWDGPLMELFAHLGEPEEGRWLMLLRDSAKHRFAETLAVLDRIPDSPSKSEYLLQLVGETAREDTFKAQELVASMPPGKTRVDAVNKLIWELADQDAYAAMALVLEEDESAHARLLKTLAEWGNPEEIAALTDIIPAEHLPTWIDKVISNFVVEDPAACARWLENYAGMEQYGKWQMHYAGIAIQDDLSAGLRYLGEITNPDYSSVEKSLFTNVYSLADAREIAKWYGRLDAQRRSPQLTGMIAPQLYRHDPRAALIWTDNLDTSAERNASLLAIAKDYGTDYRSMDRLLQATDSIDTRLAMLDQFISTDGGYLPASSLRRLIRSARLAPEAHDQLIAMIDP